jgi:pimeloyl-ACP methyl ester carboxylesterase
VQTLQRDGVTLAYTEAGSGEPPILLVHGWTCNHSYFQPQFEHFARSHRTVAVDLRGHGASDKPEQEYTADGFADDLAWLAGELGLHKPIVIGHSMGGAIVLALAQRHPDLPGAIVMVDGAAVPRRGATEAVQSFVAGLYSAAYLDVQRAFVESALFDPTDDPALRERVTREMTTSPQHVTASCIKNLTAYDFEAAARACAVPALNVVAARPIQDVQLTRELMPNLVHGQTVGAGHFLQLLVPDQLNAMIDRFLALYLPA